MRKNSYNPGSQIRYRANIRLGEQQDQKFNDLAKIEQCRIEKGILAKDQKTLRVVELFAGAGGMGLGFLMAGNPNSRYRILSSAEINPIYLKSLEENYRYFNSHLSDNTKGLIPSEFSPTDLIQDFHRQRIKNIVQEAGGIDVVIGGTPCQGFSPSNRRGWDSKKEHNKLVECFIDFSIALDPKVILLENVQGILWTPRSVMSTDNRITVVDYVEKKLRKSGYLIFPAVLDAAWYGVPQHRNRFFLLALHKDLGYNTNDFGEWGPFPLPTHGPMGEFEYVTVGEAISDLPRISNGESRILQKYRDISEGQLNQNVFLKKMREMSPPGIIEGHLVSRQADYVIERYRHIPPGGNWKNIRHMMSNYKDVDRTHSNIDRRLKWDEPSVTIGNYRKSMLVHPEQNRNLSLREATRLQSLPDWFTFCGGLDTDKKSGLTYKQQQLANAVSFLMTLEIAKYILKL
ncbi:MAG TPA: hypothetical protein DD761_15855 [Cyanobacteria bacterium UBA11691]|nr:hypothetical protein [Cyanobacteria bacterium UBA11691]